MSADARAVSAPLTVADLCRRAFPAMGAYAGQHLLGLVDTVLAGHVDARTLGSTGLGASVFIGCAVAGMGLSMGIDPFVSQAFGAGRPRHGRRALWQGVWIAALAAVPITALMLAIALCLTRLGVSEELAAGTRAYVFGRAPALFFTCVFVAQRAYLQAAHRPRALFASTLVANLVNFVGGGLLLYGDPGLHALGLPGIGLSPGGPGTLGRTAAFSLIVQTGFLALVILRIPAGEGDEPFHRPHRATILGIARMGIPLGAQMGAEVGAFALLALLMGRIGAEAAAAHQAAIMIASLTFSLALGVGSATSVEVGRAIGRGDGPGTRRAGLMGITLGVAVMGCSACVLWCFPHAIGALVASDPTVAARAAVLLRIAGVFQVFDGAQAVASGALRGAGVSRWPLVANIVAYWGIGLPLGVALADGAGLGPAGLWWGMTAALAFVATALCVKFAAVARAPIAPVHSSAGPDLAVMD